jgi:glycosyltransferase involved in cell wall biosynthesis
MKRFLFIGHEANRTGAPIVLLHFLRWAKVNMPECRIDLLLIRGGELEKEYREVAEVFVLPSEDRDPLGARGWKYLKKRFGWSASKKKSYRAPAFDRGYDAVIGNTVVSLDVLEHFHQNGIPTICWMHELEVAVRTFFTDEQFLEAAQFADRFIVPSRAVENFLRGRGIEKEVHLVYEFSVAAIPAPADAGAGHVTERLGVARDAFIVLGSGSIEWRKGVDLFVSVAERVVPMYPDIYFVWVGGETREGRNRDFDKIQYDLKQMGLAKRVVFTGQLSEPHDIFSRADIFALTSREDPFPLVCLEAGSFGKPVICFADAGGIPELVEDDAGAIAPYGDVEAFADRVLHYYSDRNDLARAGQRIKEKIGERFSLERSCDKIRQLLLNS